MAEFSVELVPAAVRDLDDVDRTFRPKLLRMTEVQLAANPFPRGKLIKRLQGFRIPTHELRVRGARETSRIVYRIEGRRVVILMIPPRKLLERYLRRLK